MPDKRRTTCRECDGHRDDVGAISWQGYCGTCGPALYERANDDLHYHRGPVFAKWRRAMVACVGGVLLDELDGEA